MANTCLQCIAEKPAKELHGLHVKRCSPRKPKGTAVHRTIVLPYVYGMAPRLLSQHDASKLSAKLLTHCGLDACFPGLRDLPGKRGSPGAERRDRKTRPRAGRKFAEGGRAS